MATLAGDDGRADTTTTPPLRLPVLAIGPKSGKRILTAERIIESLVVPSYPQTSTSTTSGVLTMVPVASVEKTVNPKSFIAYKSASGQSRNHKSLLSLNFGFCSYNWIEYPCTGVESCANVPDAVRALSHTSIGPGQDDAYASYEKLLKEASGRVPGADTTQQALSRSWDKYVTFVLPFDKRPCPNALCARLSPPPPGKIKTVIATGHSFLGCSMYTASNRVSHKNASLTNVTDLSTISKWIDEKRYVEDVATPRFSGSPSAASRLFSLLRYTVGGRVSDVPVFLFAVCICLTSNREATNPPAGVQTIEPCMTVRAPGTRLKCRAHMGDALPLSTQTLCDNVIFIGTPITDDRQRDVTGSFLIFSLGEHSHPPPPITAATRGLLLTAREVKAHHHISLAQEEEDMRQKLSEEYGRVAAAVPQECLRYARRQAVLEKNPWGQGRDAAMRMVTRALAAGDDYFRSPIVSPETGYIFPAFTDDAVRLVANGALALETDEYYKSVESLGLARDGDFFVLAITTTVRNRGITVARFFIQRATREVACVCYKMFFRRVLDLNPTWAPWHVRVAREVQRLHPHPVDETPAAV